jgi:hypothetical protein
MRHIQFLQFDEQWGQGYNSFSALLVVMAAGREDGLPSKTASYTSPEKVGDQ